LRLGRQDPRGPEGHCVSILGFVHMVSTINAPTMGSRKKKNDSYSIEKKLNVFLKEGRGDAGLSTDPFKTIAN